ncbi:MAG: hypothetical protein E7574_00700 [Ruminococcaceae bacterium]|nr:hypothetical protein [Oscillospiraceae bacterium]
MENSGIRTAYYFTTPIYNQKTLKLINPKFYFDSGTAHAVGSNADIIISDNIILKNTEGSCSIELEKKPTLVHSREVRCGDNVIIPTTNGVAMKYNMQSNPKISFIVNIGQSYLNIRANNKCFAFMKERFRPFIVFSCIGSMDSIGNVIAPAKLEYQKLADKKYKIDISTTSPLAQYVFFEANLYENKLFQDTTVESMNPLSNNAFGSIGFIGNTTTYGEQWLYTRLDYSKITEIMDNRIKKAVLHIPKLNDNRIELGSYKFSARFCSFGSNWDNKIAGGSLVSNSLSSRGYQTIDLIPLIVEPRTRTITRSEGLILKSKIKGSGFSVITTGDSCFAPQIMEISY